MGQDILTVTIKVLLFVVENHSSMASHTKFSGEQAVKNGFVSCGLQRMLQVKYEPQFRLVKVYCVDVSY